MHNALKLNLTIYGERQMKTVAFLFSFLLFSQISFAAELSLLHGVIYE